MDIVVEQLVKRKKTRQSYTGMFFAIASGLVLFWLFVMVLSEIPGFSTISLFLFAGMVYLIYLMASSANLEFEYSFVNGALDVDKIVNRRRRVAIASLNARKIEKMASVRDGEFQRLNGDSNIAKVYAISHRDDEGQYYVLYEGEKGMCMLVFQPNDEIKDGFYRLNPRKVFLDDKNGY
ncbi:MAG: hypothetical protein IKW60_02540 [Clostridia bacterium]|nr:hypothetical protein [Clostridia bacterium]